MTEELFTHQQVIEAVQAACNSISRQLARWELQAEDMAAKYDGEGPVEIRTYEWERGRASAFRVIAPLVRVNIPTLVGGALVDATIAQLTKIAYDPEHRGR